MAETTPVKLYAASCSTCAGDCMPGSRSYKLTGIKCIEDDIVQKISNLVGFDIIYQPESVICRSCITKVNAYHSFKHSVTETLRTFRDVSTKRCYHSPSPISKPIRTQKKICRNLLNDLSACALEDLSPILPHTTDPSCDHSYITQPVSVNKKQESNATAKEQLGLSILKRHIVVTPKENCGFNIKANKELYNAVKDEILLDIGNEITALSSRTVPHQSAMLQFRAADKLADTDIFFDCILQEMDEKYV